MSGQIDKAGRLAFRVEGQYWNAYWALPDTMKDAIHLGSIRMASVHNKKVKHAFMKVMRDAMSDALANVDGVESVEWRTESAPEHERSGNA